MSFSDLLSSAKGPGVIGMLLALVVLMGFGTLYMFALDGGSGGAERSMESIIRANAKVIEGDKSSIASGNERLSKIPEMKKISTFLADLTSRNTSLTLRITERKEDLVKRQEAFSQLEDEFETYKNQYRAFVRKKAEGTEIKELSVASGVIFSNVYIRKVTAVGIDIRHQDGHKRIPFKDLPGEMQDYYQFDETQMLTELERELKIRKKHDLEVAAAHQASEVMAGEEKVRYKEKERQRITRQIAVKEARLQIIHREIGQLQSDISRENSNAQAARSAGRMHLNRAGSFHGSLNNKKAEYSRIQNEIARLRASI
ncbi:MAG: hypothetical protein H7Y36_05875 [Armatimonadetes bacterium]|nr:hypothetical protein [Akkermansiaceae bacterium]